ncbi:MAG: hypothetical protein WAK91_06310 [Candidatus Acidiferrales bacterium]
MSKWTQQIVLVVLAVLLAIVVYVNFSGSQAASALPGFTPVDTKFEPLKVEDPSLRLDLLEKVRRTEYKGEHHDIFSFGPPAPTPAQKAAEAQREHPRQFVGPQKPAPPEPPQVGATFFGYATNSSTQNRLAFFSKEDDVFIVGEGGTLFNRFRLVKIGNNSAEFEEISSGLHATLSMTQPDQQPAQQQP